MKNVTSIYTLLVTLLAGYLYCTTYFSARYIFLEDIFFTCISETLPGSPLEGNNDQENDDLVTKTPFTPIATEVQPMATPNGTDISDCLEVEKYVMRARSRYEYVITPWVLLFGHDS
jgi:hypothetical protein